MFPNCNINQILLVCTMENLIGMVKCSCKYQIKYILSLIVVKPKVFYYFFCKTHCIEHNGEYICTVYAQLKVKAKSSMARNVPVENLLYHRMWGQLSTTYSNVTEVAQWEIPNSRSWLTTASHGRCRQRR